MPHAPILHVADAIYNHGKKTRKRFEDFKAKDRMIITVPLLGSETHKRRQYTYSIDGGFESKNIDKRPTYKSAGQSLHDQADVVVDKGVAAIRRQMKKEPQRSSAALYKLAEAFLFLDGKYGVGRITRRR